MKIIVTGFGSFLDNDTNPTKEILNMLPSNVDDKEIHTYELPVVFDGCFTYLKPHIDKIKPDYIIMLGLAGGRLGITPERVAINMKDSRGPDNLGYQPIDEPIIKDGKPAYFSTLPIRDIEKLLLEDNIPVHISNTAGLYVCNNIMYHTLHYIDINDLNCKAGFIHVPFAKENTSKEGVFSMPLNDIYAAIINIIAKVI